MLNHYLLLFKYILAHQDFLCVTKKFLISSSKVRKYLNLSVLYFMQIMYKQISRIFQKKISWYSDSSQFLYHLLTFAHVKYMLTCLIPYQIPLYQSSRNHRRTLALFRQIYLRNLVVLR